MVATPTSRIRLIKQGYQDNPETWGTELNAAALDLLDDARAQWVTKALSGNYTLSVQNYLTDEARAPMLRFTGTGTFTVTAPAVSMWYIVRNECTGDLTLQPSGGTGSVIRAGRTAIWTTDGTTGYTLDPTLDQIKTAAANVAMGGFKLTGVGTATSTNDAATLANKVHEFAAPTSALAMNGQKITGVGTATSTNDAATLANKIHEFATPTAPLAMGSQKITGMAAGTVSTDGATLSNRLDQFVAPTGSVSMGSQRVTSVATPVATTDAANAQYVTDQIVAAATINLPPVSGNAGRYLTTNGTVASWSEVDWAASVDVASAGTADIGAAASNRVRITGTTTITSFGTSANKTRMVLFAGALTLTHNATSLILPTGASIATAAGDVALCVSDGSGNWRVISYMRADGKPLGTITTALLDNSAVTYAKIQNVSANSRLLGSSATGSGAPPSEITLGTGLTMSGSTLSASGGFTLGTPVATTSGTAFDFTGIPSTVRVIFVMFSGVSLSGTDDMLVQIGPSGGVDTTGYVSMSHSVGSSVSTSTSGFVQRISNSGFVPSGIMTISCLNSSSNIWVASHSAGDGTFAAQVGGGTVTLSGALARLRLTRTGTNTFDAGTVNISYL